MRGRGDWRSAAGAATAVVGRSRRVRRADPPSHSGSALWPCAIRVDHFHVARGLLRIGRVAIDAMLTDEHHRVGQSVERHRQPPAPGAHLSAGTAPSLPRALVRRPYGSFTVREPWGSACCGSWNRAVEPSNGSAAAPSAALKWAVRDAGAVLRAWKFPGWGNFTRRIGARHNSR